MPASRRGPRRRSGWPVELVPSRDYSGVYEGLHGGTLDAAQLGASGYAGLFLEDTDLVEPLVTVKYADGMVGYRSVPVVRADSPYQTLDDLRNKSLAFTARLSASGFLIPYHELTEQGYEPSRFFNHLAFAGGHPEAVAAVLNGDFDAGVTWSSVIGDVEEGYSRWNLRRMVDRGLLEMGASGSMAIGADSRGARRRARSCRRRPRTSSERCCSIWPTTIVPASSGSSATARSTSNRSRTGTTKAWSRSGKTASPAGPDPVGGGIGPARERRVGGADAML